MFYFIFVQIKFCF